MLFAFVLGRESRLSLAELVSLFGREAYRSHSDQIALFSLDLMRDEMRRLFLRLGGSIRVIEILGETDPSRFPTDALAHLSTRGGDGKLSFALGSYGHHLPLQQIGLRMKKTMTQRGISSRLINQSDENIKSALWKSEKLGKKWAEIVFLSIPSTREGESRDWIGVTIACQDIDSYARRDLAKARDMQVGMLPPKLAQIMINLSHIPESRKVFDGRTRGGDKWSAITDKKKFSLSSAQWIYDPFCGLGTVLIEAIQMGYAQILGSDLSPEMVRSTESSITEFIASERKWHEQILTRGGTPHKDLDSLRSEIFPADARRIASLQRNLDSYAIVTEGYLGEVMTKGAITLDRVRDERKKLARLYEDFFAGLERLDYHGTIVMSFPCWYIGGTPSFFSEISEIRARHGFETVPLLDPVTFPQMMTREGTLIYRRSGQSVGREIWRGRRKSV